MSITVAKSAGFCFGVDRAVQEVYNLLDKGKKVCTLGPIIHNPQLVKELEDKGVKIVKSADEVESDRVLVIRSHGISKEEYDKIREKKIEFVDATCPFVKKIHNLVSDVKGEENLVFIAGDKEHPEVVGIVSHCQSEVFVFKNEEELVNLLKSFGDLDEKKMFFFAQTTFNIKIWKKCIEIVKKLCTNAFFFDTICNATSKRQSEAEKIAKDSDIMIVIGGKESSNTAKLKEVCDCHAKTFHVETAEELPPIDMGLKIGITAGASTPDRIIKEVLVIMTSIENTEINSEQLLFEQLLEESFKKYDTDEKVHGMVKGVVVSITPTEVYVDVGRKQAGFIPFNELSNDPSAKVEDIVKVGDEINLLIMKTNDVEGTIMLSKKRIDAQKGWEDLQVAKDNNDILTAKVTEVVKGGIIVVFNGVRVFIPASQATGRRGDDIEELKGTEQQFRIIEVNRQRRRAVGSIRSVLREQRKAEQEKMWENLEEGQEFKGVVKSITSFGAFVDIGGIDGMVHVSELSWTRIKTPADVVKEGDEINVFIKTLDKENGRISLGHKKAQDNPWEILKTQYPVGTVCEATIVGMTTFGAFAKVIPGIDGLIHISQIADRRIEKPQDVLKVGETVNVKITDVDFDTKRVSLSIRALLEDATEEVEA
ncbi:MAG: bifunctional 4-hydroxy-3-methylbut-2-enyl diphosphate reductase/30S ribosomal protein S1 [Clostridia bacterium]